MHLAAYDYHADRVCARKGLSLTASLITRARAETPGSILLDNGDFLQGSPLGDLVARSGPSAHLMIQAMTHLGYDAVNIGNHEFSHGMDTLIAALSQAPFPVLSANTVADPASPLSRLLRPWVIIDRVLADSAGRSHTVRIGVIGVLPPETEVWDRQAIGGQARMLPLTETVARTIPLVRSAGADIIVVLAHCGLGTCLHESPSEDGALRMAQIDGVDALIMGHVHMVFPGPVAPDLDAVDARRGTLYGKPAIMPGCFGSHLGLIDLTLARQDNRWAVVTQQVEARPIAVRQANGDLAPVAQPEPVLTALIEPMHKATLDWARQPIGTTPRAIHSFFSLVTDCPSVQIVNAAQTAYVTARLAGGPLAHLPVLSATAPFRAGGLGGPENYTFVPPGDLLLRHASDLYIHPNTIVALRLNGAALRQWLEFSVQGYRTIQRGLQDQPLLHENLPSFLYDTISGLTYEIDLTAPPVLRSGQRICNLCWQGLPLDPAQEFILATNSYRGSGSGGYALADSAQVVLAEQLSNRDILIAHIRQTLAHQTQPDRAAPAWRFRPTPGTSVIFDTSPMAAGYLVDHPDLKLTPIQLTDDGFLRLRLEL